MTILDTNSIHHLRRHVVTKLNNKVDKIDGKTLSANDFINENKEKLDSIATITIAKVDEIWVS